VTFAAPLSSPSQTSDAPLVSEVRQRFKAAGIPNAANEARWLVEGISNVPGKDLEAAVTRRLSGEPLSRILGENEFWGLTFALSPETLDPRADSETLVEIALLYMDDHAPSRILDIGTGSGCLLLSLLHERLQASGIGLDISEGALKTAQENAESLGVSDRASFQKSDCFGALGAEKFDLIVSNPPYIPSLEIDHLMGAVRNYDPLRALDGGDDGLSFYKRIASESAPYLQKEGHIIVEIGQGQAEDVQRLFEEKGFTCVEAKKDLNHITRVLVFQRKE